MRLPGVNSIVMVVPSVFDSLLISFIPAICMSCPRNGAATLVSTSLTDAPGIGTLTVILGMSISGMSDTGRPRRLRIHTTVNAITHIVTATGRFISLRIIILCQSYQKSTPISSCLYLRAVGKVHIPRRHNHVPLMQFRLLTFAPRYGMAVGV